jgi:hypothetical protein
VNQLASLLFPNGEIYYRLDGKVYQVELDGEIYLDVYEGVEKEGWRDIAKQGALHSPDCAYAIGMRENGGEPVKGDVS